MTVSFLFKALVSVVALAALVNSASAQPVLDLRNIRECRSCELPFKRVVSLGEAAGEGELESDQLRIFHGGSDGAYGVLRVGGSRIQLFNASGTFKGAFGRSGQGPGEFGRLVDAAFLGENIVALDGGGPGKILVTTRTGTVVSEALLGVSLGEFRVATDTTIIIGSMDRSQALVGYPLHLVRLSGSGIRHFGSDGQFNAGEPFADFVVLGHSVDPGSVWWGNAVKIDLAQWSVSGGLTRTVRGDIEWFRSGRQAATDPRMSLIAFGIDGDERLWTLVHVPDKNAQAAPRHGSEGYVLAKDLHLLVDTRIDVFDLKTKRHIGTALWDDASVGMVRVGTKIAVFRTIADKGDVYRVNVFTF